MSLAESVKLMMRDAATRIQMAYGNLNGAVVDDVSVGPRREVTLMLTPLLWQGGRGDYAAPIAIRFGGIQDFPRVAAEFQRLVSEKSEIGFLGPDPDRPAPRDSLHSFKCEAERSGFKFRFRCSSVEAEKVEERG